jgi:hypothetical protein
MKAFPELVLTYMHPGRHHGSDAEDDGLTGLACAELHFSAPVPIAEINASLPSVNEHMRLGRITEVSLAEGRMPLPERISFSWDTTRTLRHLDEAIVFLLKRGKVPHTREKHPSGYRYLVSPKALSFAPAREIEVRGDGRGEVILARKRGFPNRVFVELERRGFLVRAPRVVELSLALGRALKGQRELSLTRWHTRQSPRP